jgi:adenosine kinase
VRIAVCGSVATDHLMTFPGRFAEHILPDQLDRLSLSFLVDDLQIRRGGIAANICFGLAGLGLRPLLVAAVGPDFADYRAFLEEQGVDTSGVRVSELRHTARFVCTTDQSLSQLAAFYPGAMSEAREIELDPLGRLDLVVVAPDDPEAMVRHTRDAHRLGIPLACDLSQQLTTLPSDLVRELIEGADYLFCNDYESGLIEQKTGWAAAEIAERVQVRVTTHGPRGVVIDSRGAPPVTVSPVPEQRRADPTGVGDAFRAGFLAARSWGCSLERAAQLGCLLATYCLETVGTQEYELAPDDVVQRLSVTYGDAAAAEIAAHLSADPTTARR